MRSSLEQEHQYLEARSEVIDDSFRAELEECDLQRTTTKDLKVILSDLKPKVASRQSNMTPCKWDTYFRASNNEMYVKYSNDGLTVTRVKNTLYLVEVLLDIHCTDGKYKWKLKFNPHEKGIAIGIREHLNFEGASEGFFSRYACGFQVVKEPNFQEGYCRDMAIIKHPEQSGVQTFTCIVDMDAGKFQIFQGTTLIAQSINKNFTKKMMRPFAFICCVNNSVTIIPE